jgi:hypothetical protein
MLATVDVNATAIFRPFRATMRDKFRVAPMRKYRVPYDFATTNRQASDGNVRPMAPR